MYTGGIKIHLFPGDTEFFYYCYNNENANFGDLKNEFTGKWGVENGTYYVEMNNCIMNDDMLVKNSRLYDDCDVNLVRVDCIKILIEEKDSMEKLWVIHKYLLSSDLSVIKSDENKEVKVCNKNFTLYVI